MANNKSIAKYYVIDSIGSKRNRLSQGLLRTFIFLTCLFLAFSVSVSIFLSLLPI